MNRFATAVLTAGALAATLPTTAEAGPKKNSATVGVAKLAWPSVSLEYERRLMKKLGVAAYGGAGRYNPIILNVAGSDNPLASEDFRYNELGARLNFYAIGKFKHGLNLGLTVQSRGLSYETTLDSSTVSASVRSTVVGPHLGYKLMLKPGFTLGFLGGIGYHTSGDIKVTSGSDSGDLENPFADFPAMTFGTINAGWSF